MSDFDVIAIGGGPAGLAAALAARQAGLSVLVADAKKPPIDKVCGEGLLPDGVDALERLGVGARAFEGVPFDGLCFRELGFSASAHFPQTKGIGVRRTLLHAALVEQAARVGAEFAWKTRAEYAGPGRVRCGERELRCRYVVGADGQRSLVRTAAGLSAGFEKLRRRQRLAFRRHYRVRPWTSLVEVHWADRAQAYLTPVGDSEVCVAMVTTLEGMRFDQLLALFPAIALRLAGAEIASRERGGASIMLRVPRVTDGQGLFLIGEASGSVDAVTGEGLTLVFQQALALGKALATNDLRGYQRDHVRVMRKAFSMGRLLLGMSEHGGFRRRVFSALRWDPAIFENLVRFHVGEPARLWGEGSWSSLARHLVFPEKAVTEEPIRRPESRGTGF